MSATTEGNTGTATPSAAAGDYSVMAFVVRQLMSAAHTATLVQVKAVTNSGGVTAAGKVDVQPLVHQLDGNGEIVPHGTIHGLPYFRLQGGADAVILDPKVGDIGLAVFADRDVSAVVATQKAAAPGSARRNDYADGFYLGGLLNGTPTQYLRFRSDGVTILSPYEVESNAPTIRENGSVVTSDNVAVGNGASGSFTTPTGQTVMVQDGIITNIF